MKNLPLQLNSMSIREVVLKTNPRGVGFSKTIDVSTTQSFGRGNEDKNQWQMVLKVTFAPGKDQTLPLQYEGHIEVVGTFTITDPLLSEENILKAVAIMCPTLLYGTARETISFLTGRGENGVFVLPAVSFSDNPVIPAGQNRHPSRGLPSGKAKAEEHTARSSGRV